MILRALLINVHSLYAHMICLVGSDLISFLFSSQGVIPTDDIYFYLPVIRYSQNHKKKKQQ